MTTLCTSQCQDGNKVLKVYDWKCHDIKLEALENLNAQKSTSRILTSIIFCCNILKILNLSQSVSSKLMENMEFYID